MSAKIGSPAVWRSIAASRNGCQLGFKALCDSAGRRYLYWNRRALELYAKIEMERLRWRIASQWEMLELHPLTLRSASWARV
jgi:hypothetical protein